jgi:hypothetical protein
MNPSFEEVKVLVVADDAGIVGGDMALVGEREGGRVRDAGVGV